MKVLTSPTGSVLVFSQVGAPKFLAFDGTEHDQGVVAEINDRIVSTQAAAALTAAAKQIADAERAERAKNPEARGIGIPFGTGGPFAYAERRDLTRDLKFIAKSIHDVPAGTVVKVKPSGRSAIALDIPKSALPDRTAGLKVGAKVAVGPNVSPKALMNAHGVVKSVNGTKASVEFDAGDIDRVNRATGKRFATTVNIHKATLEVIA